MPEIITATTSVKPRRNLYQRWDGFGVLYDCPQPRDFKEHQHLPVQVIIPLRRASFRMNLHSAAGHSETSLLNESEVSVIASYQPHAIRCEREAEWTMFWLAPDFVERAADGLFARNSSEIAGRLKANDIFIAGLGRALQTELLQSEALPRIYAESLSNVLAVHLVRNYSKAGRVTAEPHNKGGLTGLQLRRSLEFINEHLEKDLTLAEIAATIGLSPYHFARQLKQTTGLAPHQYLVERRIERAKEMLSATKLPIVEISLAVGFQSQSHFTTVFRKHTGLTPTTYRLNA